MKDALAAVIRLELGEVVRSRWLLFCLGLYGVLIGLLVLVGARESSVLGFTGLGRVFFSLCHALVLLLPLLALTAAGPAIARAREDGSLELWLSQPIGRSTYLAGVTLVRYGALVVPLLAVFLAAAVWARLSQGEAVPWRLLGEAMSVNASLLWAFVALGLWTSVLIRSVSKTTTYLLLLWALSVALLDFALIGLMLQWRLPPRTVFVLAALNPVQTARLAILSGVEPELAVLGPVGFYLANRIGARALFALGVGWPALFGSALWLFALRAFRRRDAV